MRSSPARLATVCILLVALSGCAGPTGAAETEPKSAPTAETSGDRSCPAAADLDAVPERVVTMDAAAAAIIIELGFGGSIVGTAAPDFARDFSGGLREQLDAIAVLDSGTGSAEAVIAARPTLVTGVSPYEFGGFEGTASVAQLQAAGISALSACGASGTAATEDLDSTYRYIAALADAFQAPERGRRLIADLRAEVATAAAEVADADVPTLMLSSVPDAGTGVLTRGASSFANGVLTVAGAKNIAGDQLQDFVTLSAETVAAADPRLIVLISGFSDRSDADLKSAIVASPLLAGTTAARSGNVVVVSQRVILSPSLLNSDAVRTIADAVARAS